MNTSRPRRRTCGCARSCWTRISGNGRHNPGRSKWWRNRLSRFWEGRFLGAPASRRRVLRLTFLATILSSAGSSFGQFRAPQSADPGLPVPGSGHYVRIEGGLVVNEDEIQTAREVGSHSSGTPNWTNAPGFQDDVFTFARIIFQSDSRPRPGRSWFRWLGWWVDFPDADLNFSYRLQQLTSIKTDPDARVLKLTDPKLDHYPLLYIEHAGYMRLEDDEISALRHFLLNGGALFVNDFWGAEEWNGFASQMKKVLPGRDWIELTTDHPVFSCVYNLRGAMSRLQVPTIQFWNRSYDPGNPQSEMQTIFRGEGSKEMHVRAVLDDRSRIMVLAIHNSDVSDGWEREGENELYFREFSEKIAYPLGINIIFYLMTH